MTDVPPRLWLLPILFTLNLSSACDVLGTGPTVATPMLSLNRSSVPRGGPLKMTYRFTASPEITTVTEPYRVFVHFLDADGKIIFTGISDLLAPDGTFIHPRAAERTKFCLAHNRAAPEAVI